MTIKKVFLSIIGFLVFSSSYAQDLSGYWQGIFNSDLTRVRGSFFLNMVLHQEGKKVEGRFSNSSLDAKNIPEVVFEISGVAGKKEKIPSRLRAGHILYNILPLGIAEIFLEFDQIRYLKNDTMEVLYGRWMANGYNAGGTFWVRKLPAKDTMQKNQMALDASKKLLGEAIRETDRSIPEQMITRKNVNHGRIEVNTKQVTLQLYDNGIVDNDTVSIFFNGKLLLSHQRVSANPIVINVELDDKRSSNEMVLFAENLGSIPPNTALVIVTAGNKRYELSSKADLKENAVLVFEYKPD